MTAVDELRAAAETLRRWVAESAAGRFAPDAVAAFGPELADWLETTAARLDATTHPGWQDAVEPKALALARAVNTQESI